jgi:Bacterial protein of unknown function (DUF899)
VEKDFRFDTERGSETLKRPFPWPLATADPLFHVRPGLCRRLPFLFVHRRWLERICLALVQPRRDTVGSSAGAAGKLTAYKQRIGWSFPWASSCQADFNFDYQVSITEEQQREGVVPYNYQPGALMIDLKSRPPGVAAHAADRGTDAAPPISATGPA